MALPRASRNAVAAGSAMPFSAKSGTNWGNTCVSSKMMEPLAASTSMAG
jgi:hypothetical protein